MTANDNQQWAIIELFGHQKIAGRYSEHGAMYRVDVPGTVPDASPNQFRFTRLYGPNAIYSITFVDEETARLAARHLEVEPIAIYELRQEIKRLAAPARAGDVIEEPDDEEDDDGDDEELYDRYLGGSLIDD